MLMKTDIVKIHSDLYGRQEAVRTADRFNGYNKFTGRNAMHIRLLTEELICMVHGVMDNFKADLWLESEFTEEGVLCRICVSAKKAADPRHEKHLLSIASSGRNESAKGILGLIREIFRVSLQQSSDAADTKDRLPKEKNGQQIWSLSDYREETADNGKICAELERSIIANLSDDVKVWLKKDSTEVVIEKLIKQ